MLLMWFFPKKAIRHTSFSLLAEIFNAFMSIFLTGFLARHLGVKGYSEYSLVFTYTLMFLSFTDWGFSSIAIREMARFPEKTKQIFSVNFTLRILFSIAAWIICLISTPFIKYPPA